ncbi:MAG: NfeD family protein [Proteobacteria bacterium]|nr:NfeD family protein [Pseudomonadota bacterium]
MKDFHRFRLLSRQAKKNLLVRYALFQIPDVLILLLALAILQRWVNMPCWLVWGVVAFWLLKDIVMFPFVWRAFEAVSADARQALIGAEGVAAEELAPSGYIRVHGVLWRARVMEQGEAVHKGDNVVVSGVEGLLFTVRPADKKGKNA